MAVPDEVGGVVAEIHEVEEVEAVGENVPVVDSDSLAVLEVVAVAHLVAVCVGDIVKEFEPVIVRELQAEAVDDAVPVELSVCEKVFVVDTVLVSDTEEVSEPVGDTVDEIVCVSVVPFVIETVTVAVIDCAVDPEFEKEEVAEAEREGVIVLVTVVNMIDGDDDTVLVGLILFDTEVVVVTVFNIDVVESTESEETPVLVGLTLFDNEVVEDTERVGDTLPEKLTVEVVEIVAVLVGLTLLDTEIVIPTELVRPSLEEGDSVCNVEVVCPTLHTHNRAADKTTRNSITEVWQESEWGSRVQIHMTRRFNQN